MNIGYDIREMLSAGDGRQIALPFMKDVPPRGAGYRVAVLGATGAVGRLVLRVLKERQFPVSELMLFASESSGGTWRDTAFGMLPVRTLRSRKAPEVDFAFLAVSADISRLWARRLARRGAMVIDKSSYFRMMNFVPLIIPEINPELIDHNRRIFAVPNCTTISVAMVLAPLHRAFGLKGFTAVSFQSVSGQGLDGLRALERELEDLTAQPSTFTSRVAFNVIPWIGGANARGICSEEQKLIAETRRILALPRLPIRATTVRVPTRVGHGVAVHAEFKRKVNLEHAYDILAAAQGIIISDKPPTPLDVAGRDEVMVGRLRQDRGRNHLAFWIVADNLRKGAATTAVQIAELLIKRGFVRSTG